MVNFLIILMYHEFDIGTCIFLVILILYIYMSLRFAYIYKIILIISWLSQYNFIKHVDDTLLIKDVKENNLNM